MSEDTTERSQAVRESTYDRSGRGPRAFLSGVFRSYRWRRESQPFVILFVPRTGSNYLAALLDTHPDVLCHHELFLPDSAHRSLSVREGLVDLDVGSATERDRNPYAFLHHIFGNDLGRKAVGFKMALSDANRLVLLSIILNRSIAKVIVRRDNWLQVYTSALIAEETNTLIRFASGETDGQRSASPKVHVDARSLRRYVRKRRFGYGLLNLLLRATAQRSFWLEYHQMQEGRRLKELLGFLGVASDVELRARTVKQNPSRLRDRIANFDEVYSALEGTRYATFLSDD
ncbi:MAG: hypothetical protein ACREL7_18925 [Longimicrobiales bacterium]